MNTRTLKNKTTRTQSHKMTQQKEQTIKCCSQVFKNHSPQSQTSLRNEMNDGEWKKKREGRASSNPRNPQKKEQTANHFVKPTKQQVQSIIKTNKSTLQKQSNQRKTNNKNKSKQSNPSFSKSRRREVERSSVVEMNEFVC